jgi:hypothetical protein
MLNKTLTELEIFGYKIDSFAGSHRHPAIHVRLIVDNRRSISIKAI